LFTIGGETPGASGTLFPVPALGSGASHTVTRQLTLNVAQGYINTATADYNHEVAESNEANNTTEDRYTVTSAGQPDLIVESLTHSPANPTTADLITFIAVVKNVGTGSAGGSTLLFTIGGETPGAPETLFSVGALSAGGTATFERKTTLTAGNYQNTATADEIRDAGGNLIPKVTNPVTLSLSSNPGGETLSGTLTKNGVGGVATLWN